MHFEMLDEGAQLKENLPRQEIFVLIVRVPTFRAKLSPFSCSGFLLRLTFSRVVIKQFIYNPLALYLCNKLLCF